MYVRPSIQSDAKALAPELRQADRDEVYAAAGVSGFFALQQGYEHSECCMTVCEDVEDGGKPVGMFGVVPHGDKYPENCEGTVWFLGSSDVTRQPKAFHRLAKEWLAQLQDRYAWLGNFVDCRNTKHVRWIKALGFEFIEVYPAHGHEGRPFLKFEWSTPCVTPGQQS